MKIIQIHNLPANIDTLVNESVDQRFRAIEKLKQNFNSGNNTFDKAGEALFAAYIDNTLIGICGLNSDPYINSNTTGRVRHLYVLLAYRNQQVGKQLVKAVEQHATCYFKSLRLYTDSDGASLFYTKLGYQIQNGEHVSHFKGLNHEHYYQQKS